jgi:putative transposase
MRKKSYTVKLTDEQKEQLKVLINKGKHSARVIKRARVLLMAEQDKKDEEISALVGYCISQVKNIRKRFFLEGLEHTLKERPRPGAPLKLNRRNSISYCLLESTRRTFMLDNADDSRQASGTQVCI